MFANTLTLYLAFMTLAANLVAGEATFYGTIPASEIQIPSSTKGAAASWTTSFIAPRFTSKPGGSSFDNRVWYAQEIFDEIPPLEKRINVVINQQPRNCNKEADFNPHPPIHSDKQLKGADYFCNNYAGFMESGMKSLRVEWHDEFKGRHQYKVSWAEGCVTDGDRQHVKYPNGLSNTNPSCNDLMRDNYLQCNNGGVGGRVQVGCLVYAYNGGTVAGRDYESIGLCFLLNSIININLHILPTDTNPAVFGAAKMSTVHIKSAAEFQKLLSSSRIVVADFYADWCGPCKAIAPLYEQLSSSLSRKNVVTFVKIDVESQKEIASAYSVTSLPTFMIFREGKTIEKVQGADPRKLQEVVKRLAKEVSEGASGSGEASGSSSGGNWRGAEFPRGYGDVTGQIEPKGCELLNADEDFGPVKVLFDPSKPSALAKKEGVKDWVESGADDQLLLFMPFQSMIKLHTLQLTSLPPTDDDDDEAPMRPGTIHLYTNKPHNLDFGEADDTPPTQAIELTEKDWNADGTANIGLRFVKFQNINSLIIYVTKGDGDGEKVRLDRVRLIGESGEKREMGKLEKIGDEAGE
ncbi:hypothetical protein CaCOL14_003053 [Colletotrichum acutatum]